MAAPRAPTPQTPGQRARDAEETRIGWRMAAIGMTVASEVAAGAIVGWLFDYWRGSGHIGVLVGSIAGISVGLFSLIRQSLKLNTLLDRNAPPASRTTRADASPASIEGSAPPTDDPAADDWNDWEDHEPADDDNDDWNADHPRNRA